MYIPPRRFLRKHGPKKSDLNRTGEPANLLTSGP